MDLAGLVIISAINAAAAAGVVIWGWPALRGLLARQEAWYQRVLVDQLLMDVDPRTLVWLSLVAVAVAGVLGAMLLEHLAWGLVFAVVAAGLPNLLIKNAELRRREKLEAQLVDGITTLASGVRAGLNLVQSMELLVNNLTGPIRQEFRHLLREYEMGLDLNQGMRNASDRIRSPNYRLVFTAIEMHRARGGDAGESLDRIAQSIREIQRLEGKLDALTSQGRTQARMMAIMPAVFLGMMWLMDPAGVTMLFAEPAGRAVLLTSVALIVLAVWWIRRIMDVDI